MKKLLSSEDSGVGMSGCNDPIVEMAMTAFTSLIDVYKRQPEG